MTSLGIPPRRAEPFAPPEVRHASPSPTISRNVVIVIVPILLVLITFLFWYQTWFGRPLTDREMGQYLADTRAPHKIQHALAQLSSRMARGVSGLPEKIQAQAKVTAQAIRRRATQKEG